MCSALVAMKTWILDRRAPPTASAAASRSAGSVRASAATVGRLTAEATARTPSKSPGDEIGKPGVVHGIAVQPETESSAPPAGSSNAPPENTRRPRTQV